MNDILSSNLKRLRLEKKLTQEQAAESLGVSPQSVSRWECGTTLPDVLMLPLIARLYCVTIDDLYQKKSIAYDNYAQRLSSVYEATRDPLDFIRADVEYQKLFKSGEYTREDLRIYGINHQFMMCYCTDKALSCFDAVLNQAEKDNVYWQTKRQKIGLLAQLGRNQETLNEELPLIEAGCDQVYEWICLLSAYQNDNNPQKAYEYLLKAVQKFPDVPLLYVYGGDICRTMKKYDEAFSYWNKALILDPSLYDARYSKGFCYEELGEFQKAYSVWCDIAESLIHDGYEAEIDFPKKLAAACLDKLKSR